VGSQVFVCGLIVTWAVRQAFLKGLQKKRPAPDKHGQKRESYCCRGQPPGAQKTNRQGGKDMQVQINRGGCIGCGLCAALCPEVFRMAEDGLAEVYEAPSGENGDKVLKAAENCPVSVIHTEK